MEMTLAIDPGTKATGWAVFDGRKLSMAGLLRAKDAAHMAQELALLSSSLRLPAAYYGLYIERPQVYSRYRTQADPNDLIGVALVAGAALGIFSPFAQGVSMPRPMDWKGQLPKEIHHRRIFAELDLEERRGVELGGVPKSLIHNVNDAIGLGLWAVGRLSR